MSTFKDKYKCQKPFYIQTFPLDISSISERLILFIMLKIAPSHPILITDISDLNNLVNWQKISVYDIKDRLQKDRIILMILSSQTGYLWPTIGAYFADESQASRNMRSLSAFLSYGLPLVKSF